MQCFANRAIKKKTCKCMQLLSEISPCYKKAHYELPRKWRTDCIETSRLSAQSTPRSTVVADQIAPQNSPSAATFNKAVVAEVFGNSVSRESPIPTAQLRVSKTQTACQTDSPFPNRLAASGRTSTVKPTASLGATSKCANSPRPRFKAAALVSAASQTVSQKVYPTSPIIYVEQLDDGRSDVMHTDKSSSSKDVEKKVDDTVNSSVSQSDALLLGRVVSQGASVNKQDRAVTGSALEEPSNSGVIEQVEDVGQKDDGLDRTHSVRDDLIDNEEEEGVGLFDDLTYATAYRNLLNRIFAKEAGRVEQKIDLRTPWQKGHRTQKISPQKLTLNHHVKARLSAVDQALEKKKDSVKPAASFPPFLRANNLKAYKTGDGPDTKISNKTYNTLGGLLDEYRTKFLEQSKVAFTMPELESLFKSVFRQLEIWSLSTSALDIIADGFEYIREKIPEEDRPILDEFASFIMCVDKAGRHGIGEASYAFANLLLRKREHVLSFCKRNVTQSQKSDLLFAPVSGLKLFDSAIAKESVKEIRQANESVAIANAALSRNRFFRNYNPSPLQPPRGAGRGRTRFRGNRPSYQTQAYWKRRDRYIKNARRGQW